MTDKEMHTPGRTVIVRPTQPSPDHLISPRLSFCGSAGQRHQREGRRVGGALAGAVGMAHFVWYVKV